MDDKILSDRKKRIFTNITSQSKEDGIRGNKNVYSHNEHIRYLKFLVPEGMRILDLGCGTGNLLAALKPSYGVGIDFNPISIQNAKQQYPDMVFITGDVEKPDILDIPKGPFDIIILSDIIGELDDIQSCFSLLHQHCSEETRIIITYYNTFWEPLIKIGELFGLKNEQVEQNWLSSEDIKNILELADFEVIKQDWRQLIPFNVLGLGHLINKYFGTLPVIRKLCLRNYAIARFKRINPSRNVSTTILIPCRNERGNIENAIVRTPRFCEDIEIIFVEGHSRDGTFEEIQRVIKKYPEFDIKCITQPGIGKADAVRAGFDIARGEFLMILDADLTMPPEDLPKYYTALITGNGEFINGSRLVYPMEKEAMRFLNQIANRIFSLIFTYLLNQRFTDTLCGTKALRAKHYRKIINNRSYFGDFDPFGDFDLIFGATKINLKVVEIPIRYASREYGTTQISRFRHGILLLQMVFFAFRKMKSF